MVVPVSQIVLPHLRTWRLRAALSQEDLAELAGVARSTVINAERGQSILPSTLRALAKALRLKPHELLGPPPT